MENFIVVVGQYRESRNHSRETQNPLSSHVTNRGKTGALTTFLETSFLCQTSLHILAMSEAAADPPNPPPDQPNGAEKADSSPTTNGHDTTAPSQTEDVPMEEVKPVEDKFEDIPSMVLEVILLVSYYKLGGWVANKKPCSVKSARDQDAHADDRR